MIRGVILQELFNIEHGTENNSGEPDGISPRAARCRGVRPRTSWRASVSRRSLNALGAFWFHCLSSVRLWFANMGVGVAVGLLPGVAVGVGVAVGLGVGVGLTLILVNGCGVVVGVGLGLGEKSGEGEGLAEGLGVGDGFWARIARGGRTYPAAAARSMPRAATRANPRP